MANANVGHIKCPIQNEFCVVRRDCRGKLYYYSQAGKITPNLPQGQEWMQANAVLWGNPNQPPEGVELKTVVNGAPPQVIINASSRTEKPTENPLTPQGAEKRTENPPEPVTEKPKKKRTQSALAYLLGGE